MKFIAHLRKKSHGEIEVEATDQLDAMVKARRAIATGKADSLMDEGGIVITHIEEKP